MLRSKCQNMLPAMRTLKVGYLLYLDLMMAVNFIRASCV